MKRKSNFSLPSKIVLLIFTTICLLLIVTSFTSNISVGPIKTVSGYVFVPIQKGINEVGLWFSNKSDYFKNLKEVIASNEELQSKVDELTAENSNLQQDKYELERLRTLLKLDDTYSSYDKVAARIIGKDAGNWFNVFMIDKGSEDGLKVDMNVIAGSGLVGIITEVGPNYATVRSIIDDTSNVSGVDLTTQDLCVIEGNLKTMNTSQSIPLIDMRDTDGNVNIGDAIVTSQISDKYLEGILIGYISEISEDSNNLTKSGSITPVVDFEHLEEVLVITELK